MKRNYGFEALLADKIKKELHNESPDVWEKICAGIEINKNKPFPVLYTAQNRYSATLRWSMSVAVAAVLTVSVLIVSVIKPGVVDNAPSTSTPSSEVSQSSASAASSMSASTSSALASSSTLSGPSDSSSQSQSRVTSTTTSDSDSNKSGLPDKAAALPYDCGGRLMGACTSNDSINTDLVDHMNNFGISLYKNAYKDNQNIFMSPTSMYLELGLTYNGAGGQTANEFRKVLGTQGLSITQFNEQCRDLQYAISGYSKSRFSLANAVFVDKNFSGNISADFLSRDKAYFGASLIDIDLKNRGAQNIINSWIAKNTNGLIKSGVDNINDSSAMSLINSAYFKADWSEKFNANLTSDAVFYASDGNKVVRMMHGLFTGYENNNLFQGAVLPYADGKTSMAIMLPQNNINELTDKITVDDITSFVKNNLDNNSKVCLNLPHVSFAYDNDLSGALKRQGLTSAFDTSIADFGGMLFNPDLKRQFSINNINQRTYLEIDENGTEAAASSDPKVDYGPVVSGNTEVMYVNRPFLVSIVDNQSGAILFIGAVNNPAQG